jgi:UDP-N-acetylmuramoyl-tripeptide--D-alanyl-D-alanine ligase
MQAALQVLHDLAGVRRKIAVLGDMFELGSYEEEGHRLVGELAARMGLEILLTVGDRANHIVEGAKSAQFNGILMHFDSKQDAVSFLSNDVRPGDVILVKASRGMHMEEIVEALSHENKFGVLKEDIS